MSEWSQNVLFRGASQAVAPDEISRSIDGFGYKDPVRRIIRDSAGLDINGKVFARCTALILSRFGMTRSGPFMGVVIKRGRIVNRKEVLLACWKRIGADLLDIRESIATSGYSRDRYLLELDESDRTELAARIWSLTKQLLPMTMGQTSYGLVGASKILFSVLPEIVLPIDNRQWVSVFRTVDLGDVIQRMASEIRSWEKTTGAMLNEMDRARELTTLPSVYNVMAMAARDCGDTMPISHPGKRMQCGRAEQEKRGITPIQPALTR